MLEDPAGIRTGGCRSGQGAKVLLNWARVLSHGAGGGRHPEGPGERSGCWTLSGALQPLAAESPWASLALGDQVSLPSSTDDSGALGTLPPWTQMEASCPAWLGSGPDFEMETEARVVADHSSGLEGETHQEAAGPSQAGPARPGTQTQPLSLFGSHADEKVRRWHLPPPLKLREPGPPARKLRCSLGLQDETSPEPDGAPGPASQPSPAPTRPMPISLCGAPAEVGWECPAPSLPEAPSLPKQLLLVPDLDWPLLGAPAGARISPSSHDPSPQELWRIGACAWL